MDGLGTRQVLESLNNDILKSLARQVGLPKSVTRKAELVEGLERFLASQMPSLLPLLSDSERKCLAEAVHGDGSVPCEVFAAKYGLPCPIPRTSTWMGFNGAPKPVTPFTLVAWYEEGEVCVPGEMVERLRPLLAKPEPLTMRTLGSLPAQWAGSGRIRNGEDGGHRPVCSFEAEGTVFQELRRVLCLVQAGKVKIAPKSGRPTDAAVRVLGGALVQSDLLLEPPAANVGQWTLPGGAVRAHAWGVLVQQCGWCKASGQKLELTRAGKAMLSSGGAEAFREGVERCLLDDEFDELNRINHIRGQSGKARKYMTSPSERKDAIRGSMEQWPAGQWVAFEEALRFVYASGRRLRVYSRGWGGLYFAELQYGQIHDDEGLSAQYLRAFLMETLGTLGLVDLAYVYPHWVYPDEFFRDAWGTDELDYCGRYDGLLAVRMNALGAYCLGQSDAYRAPAAGKKALFTVLANLELAVTGGEAMSSADAAALGMFASRESDRVWRIDGRRILDHIESGGELDDVPRYLEAGSVQELPQTVRVFLADLRAKLDVFGGSEEALLLEVKSPAVAALIAHDSQAGKYCCLAGEGRLAVAKKNLRGFRGALKSLGYLLPR
jgi:hypothetical protein